MLTSQKKNKGLEFQLYFWKASWPTYEKEFIESMKKLGEISLDAASNPMAYPPYKWCCAYFNSISKC